MRFIFIFLLLLCGCLQRDITIFDPMTNHVIKKIKVLPTINLTNYDDEPFTLERSTRQFLRQKYHLELIDHGYDFQIKLTFISFHRGRLLVARNSNTGRTLRVQAQLDLLDLSGKTISTSKLSEAESFQDERPDDFEKTRDALFRRLSERLVVDLLEF